MIKIIRTRYSASSLQQLLAISKTELTLLPGDRAQKGVILIFEDALFGVYHHLFPFLKEANLRILLGVSPRYILDTTYCQAQERLAVPYGISMQDGVFEKKAPFCTWTELYEMVRSGHVEIAAQSFSKMRLHFPFVNLEREILESKETLEKRLPQAVTSFIGIPAGSSSCTPYLKHFLHCF